MNDLSLLLRRPHECIIRNFVQQCIVTTPSPSSVYVLDDTFILYTVLMVMKDNRVNGFLCIENAEQ